jgi:GTPase SAR1 family protein
MQIDGIDIPTLADSEKRFSLLLWGPAGCGKTVWAASLPGRKLLINFDPDGPSSLGDRTDVVVIDLSGEKHNIVDKFKTDDDPLLPLAGKSFRLSKILVDLDISGVIVDSCSAFSQLATDQGISVTKGATVERPSPGAYGARNALTLRMMSGILRTTKRFNKHVIFITHEDDSGVRDSEGNLLHITMLIGGKLGSQTALQISEVWHITDDGKTRKVMIRPGRMRKPMKTRMFDATSTTEFVLKYKQSDEDSGDHSLADFISTWEENNHAKIQVPK